MCVCVCTSHPFILNSKYNIIIHLPLPGYMNNIFGKISTEDIVAMQTYIPYIYYFVGLGFFRFQFSCFFLLECDIF